MSGTEKEVIGAYNAFIEDHKRLAKEKELKIKCSLFLFDDKYEEVYSKQNIDKVSELDSSIYYVRGLTALHDAIGKTINSFKDKKKVIFFVETDGYENSSREFNSESVKALVKEQTDKGWDFNFVGADLDKVTATKMSDALGFGSSKTVSINKSNAGYTSRNEVLLEATRAYVSS